MSAAIAAAGAVFPGMLCDPVNFAAGPYYWHAMGLAVVTLTIPLYVLAASFRNVAPHRRRQLGALFAAGVFCYMGSWANAALLSTGRQYPYGMFLVLGSLFLLGYVVRSQQDARFRRLLDRGLVYSGLTALASAVVFFAVLELLPGSRAPFGEYGYGGVFLLVVMALLAFEPLRQRVQEWIGHRLAPHDVAGPELAQALAAPTRWCLTSRIWSDAVIDKKATTLLHASSSGFSLLQTLSAPLRPPNAPSYLALVW